MKAKTVREEVSINIRERLMAVFHREEPDVIPWTMYQVFLPRGSWEREIRNMGFGLVNLVPTHLTHVPKVKMELTKDLAIWSREERLMFAETKHEVNGRYVTPVGSVSTKYKIGYSPPNEWTLQHLIKSLPDYDVVKFMVEETEYTPNYKDFLKAEREVGDDGVILGAMPKSPLQCMLYDLMGCERFSLDYFMHRKEFDDLYRVMSEKELEAYRIAADSPAKVVWCGDNINGVMTSPKLFDKYLIPFYDKVTSILHRKGKLFAVHMDGRLKCIVDSIRRSKVDVLEAFTLPPVGDLPVEEARTAWKGKIIWQNMSTVCAYEPDKVEKNTVDLLRSVAPGDNYMLGLTEDVPPEILEESLRNVTKAVMKYGTYPISKG